MPYTHVRRGNFSLLNQVPIHHTAELRMFQQTRHTAVLMARSRRDAAHTGVIKSSKTNRRDAVLELTSTGTKSDLRKIVGTQEAVSVTTENGVTEFHRVGLAVSRRQSPVVQKVLMGTGTHRGRSPQRGAFTRNRVAMTITHSGQEGHVMGDHPLEMALCHIVQRGRVVHVLHGALGNGGRVNRDKVVLASASNHDQFHRGTRLAESADQFVELIASQVRRSGSLCLSCVVSRKSDSRAGCSDCRPTRGLWRHQPEPQHEHPNLEPQ